MSRWDIVLHLPEVTQKKFLYTIAELVLKVSRRNKKMLKRAANGEPMLAENIEPNREGGIYDQSGEGSPTKREKKIQSLMDAVDDIKKEPDHDFISKLITDHFSTKVFDMVNDFLYKKSNEEIDKYDEGSDREPDENGVYSDQYESYSDDEEGD